MEPSPGSLSTVRSPPISRQKLAADRQPEPGPAVLAPGGGLGLGERLEQPAELLLGHPDPGVGDGEGQPVARPAPARARTVSVIVPWSVNLAAFESRLNSACRTLVWSACIVADVVGAGDDQRVAVLLDQRLDDRLDVARPASATSNVSRNRSIRPASILERSRMSLISPSRCLPARVDLLEVREEAPPAPRSSASSWSISE